MVTRASLSTPLKSWRLRCFKSAMDVELAFAPLTLIAGENSSGKSTLLQSILLLAQVSRQNPTDEAFSLNGDLVSLGQIENIRSVFASAGDDVGIGATFDIGSRLSRTPPSLRRTPSRMEERPMRISDLELNWDLALSGSPANRPGATHVQANRVRLDSGEMTVTVDLKRRERAPAEDRLAFELGQTLVPIRGSFSLAYQGHVHAPGSADESVEVSGAATRGAFPAALLVRDTEAELFAREWWEAHIMRRSRVPGGREARQQSFAGLETSEQRFERVVDEAMRQLQQLRSTEGEHDENLPPSVFRPFSRLATELLDDPEIHGRFPEFLDAMQGRIADSRDVLTPSRDVWARLLEDAATAVRRLLIERTSYLGPLRQDPQIQQRTPAGTAADLGTKGELTAATLYARKDQLIVCPELDGEPQRRRLDAAVVQWASYLGIADEVNPVDLGRPGIELRVRPHDLDREVDLTAVGVGVSQLLPVLVLCLLSEPGGIVLLEQPELHLHPAIQQRLGDFLLACARTGRQLIVETHSEHLISRLRKRAAEDETDEIVNLFTIVFAELENGMTQLRPVRTNRFGGLDEWPRGFFDQGISEAREILELGLRKKQSEEPAGT